MALHFIHGKLENIRSDAVVVSANQEPFCSDGVDQAVFAAAGESVMSKARKMVGKIEVGQAKYTSAFSLPAKYVVHTVSPMWRGGGNGEQEMLSSCYRISLSLAKQLCCKSIAFPLIGTKSGRIPRKVALQIAVSEFSSFLNQNDLDIYLVLFDDKAASLAKSTFQSIDFTDQLQGNAILQQSAKADNGQKPPYIISDIGKSRYAFEHQILRDYFFKNTRSLINTALQENGLFEFACKFSEMSNWKNPYIKTDFIVNAMRWNEDISFVAIELPAPEYSPLCYRIYMFFSDNFSHLGYYTIEAGATSHGFLCGWEGDTHLNYAEIPSPEWDDRESAISRSLEANALIRLHADRFDLDKKHR